VQHHPKHYCGVFGIHGHPNAAELTYYGLYALQHRGQESAGIVTTDGKTFNIHRGMGLVPQVFTGDVLHRLVGHTAIGHTRYSTTGSSNIVNAQPLTVDCAKGRNCARNSRPADPSSRPRWTARSFCTCWPNRPAPGTRAH
jgi:amidophosphoribosyltransferase